jgi:hypothetical protein
MTRHAKLLLVVALLFILATSSTAKQTAPEDVHRFGMDDIDGQAPWSALRFKRQQQWQEDGRRHWGGGYGYGK